VTAKITRAASIKGLAHTLRQAVKEQTLNSIHVAAAFKKLVDLAKPRNFVGQDRSIDVDVSDGIWAELCRQVRQLLIREEMKARDLAATLTAIAKLRSVVPGFKDLTRALIEGVPDVVADMSERSLSDVLWAFGVLQLESAEAVAVRRQVRDQARQKLSGFTPHDLTQAMWGLAVLSDASFVDEVYALVIKHAPQSSNQVAMYDLPTIACAFARLRQWRPRLMEQIAARMSPIIPRLKRWELAALVWTWQQEPRHAGAGKAAARPRSSKSQVQSEFLQALRKEAAERGLTAEEVERSQWGPDESWFEASRSKSELGAAQH